VADFDQVYEDRPYPPVVVAATVAPELPFAEAAEALLVLAGKLETAVATTFSGVPILVYPDETIERLRKRLRHNRELLQRAANQGVLGKLPRV
jgi:hypothetical protein